MNSTGTSYLNPFLIRPLIGNSVRAGRSGSGRPPKRRHRGAYFTDSSERKTRVFPSVAECLNAHWIRSFREVQRIVETCAAKYDVRRFSPGSAGGRLPTNSPTICRNPKVGLEKAGPLKIQKTPYRWRLCRQKGMDFVSYSAVMP